MSTPKKKRITLKDLKERTKDYTERVKKEGNEDVFCERCKTTVKRKDLCRFSTNCRFASLHDFLNNK